ncbi:hypothetical protein ADG881_87 [Alcanivorax sp. DG881]|nr:hypothetical protein ADG881_87 [Alcanivorax sp. DG881]
MPVSVNVYSGTVRRAGYLLSRVIVTAHQLRRNSFFRLFIQRK